MCSIILNKYMNEKNLLPQFIGEQFLKGKEKGYFSGIIVSVDISGFTALTEKLMASGSSGAEVLSDILNVKLGDAVSIIYSSGGWVAGFAGDAFMAVFPEDNFASAHLAASRIRDYFNKIEMIRASGEDISLQVRIGISRGRLYWGIISGTKRYHYYFKGQAALESFKAQNRCAPGQIEIAVAKKYRDSTVKIKQERKPSLPLSIISKFIEPSVMTLTTQGEFRNVVSIFISAEKKGIDLKEVLKEIQSQTEAFGGYLNKALIDNKGISILVFFGAPTALEEPIAHAFDLALRLRARIPSIKMGITFGKVYAGFVGGKDRSEYTCLGKVVNLSARLMASAKAGEILIGENAYSRSEGEFSTDNLGKAVFKGFSEPVTVRRIIEKKVSSDRSFLGNFFGREIHLQQLEHWLERVIEGSDPGFLYVDGAGGLGKSRLVHRFRQLNGEGIQWIKMPCDEMIREGYNPIISGLKDYFSLRSSLSSAASGRNFSNRFHQIADSINDSELKRELIRTKSFVAALLGVSTKGTLYEKIDAKARRENTITGLKCLFRAISGIKPLIIELDDGQWVDSDTVNFFKELFRASEKHFLGVISECRYDEKGQAMHFDLGDTQVERMSLESLPASQARKIVEDRLGGKVDDRLFESIKERSSGNTFYFEQTALFIQETAAIEKRGGVWYLKQKDLEIPDKISSILISRMDRLEHEIRHMVHTAAVLGREFPVDILSLMLSGEFADDSLERGEQYGIWVPLNELNYIFRSILFRDAAYQMQLKKTLKHLHLLAAHSIEQKYEARLSEYYSVLAFHYQRGEDDDKARKYLLLAADDALSKYKNEDALGHYSDLLPLVADRVEELGIRSKIGDINQTLGHWKTAQKVFEDNLLLAEKHEVLLIIDKARSDLGSLLRAKGEYDRAESLYKEVLKNTKRRKDPLAEAVAEGNLGIIHYKKGKYAQAITSYEKEYDIAEKLNNKAVISTALGNLGLVFYKKGDLDKAHKNFSRKIHLDERSGDLSGSVSAIGNLGLVLLDQGDIQGAMTQFKKQLKLSKRLGDRSRISSAVGHLGNAYWELGQLDQAERSFQKYHTVSKELGDLNGESISIGNLGVINLQRGNYEKAAGYLKEKLRIAEKLEDPGQIAYALGNLGIACIESDDIPAAKEHFLRVISIAKKIGNKMAQIISFDNLANLFKEDGEFTKAASYCDKAVEMATLAGAKGVLPTLYCHRGENLMHLKKYDEVLEDIKEGESIAKELSQAGMIFQINMLRLRLDAAQGKASDAVRKATKFLDETTDQEDLAAVYKLIWEISADDKSRKAAIRIYTKLNKAHSAYRFRLALKHLSL